MSEYHDYLELFEYFGRDGMERLSSNRFDECSAEFSELLRQRPNLSSHQVDRVIELRTLLLSDRPRISEVKPKTRPGDR